MGIKGMMQLVLVVVAILFLASMAHADQAIYAVSGATAGESATPTLGSNATFAHVARPESISTTVAPIPEPGTLVLFGTGLLCVAAVIRRRLSS